MVTRQEKTSFILTFIMGVFAGGYLYLTGFATTFEPPQASENDVYKEFVITAESYGQCELDGDCLSFQVLENGTYRAIQQFNGEPITKEARIPFSLRGDLFDTLTPTVLALDSEVGGEGCRYDDTNYRFSVTRDEVEYVIDTCETLIDYEGSAWKILANLWNYMAGLEWVK